MPTVFRQGRFRFYFFSNERNEPPHVHVESGDGYGSRPESAGKVKVA
jgi:hypothetical protein